MEIFETYGNVQKTMEIFEKSRRRNKSKTYLHLFVNPQRIQEHKKQETHSKTQDTKNKAKKRNKKHKTKKWNKMQNTWLTHFTLHSLCQKKYATSAFLIHSNSSSSCLLRKFLRVLNRHASPNPIVPTTKLPPPKLGPYYIVLAYLFILALSINANLRGNHLARSKCAQICTLVADRKPPNRKTPQLAIRFKLQYSLNHTR